MAMEKKYIYFFGSGKADGTGTMKDALGGKGAGLAEMTNAGVPVPRGSPLSPRSATCSMTWASACPTASTPRCAST